MLSMHIADDGAMNLKASGRVTKKDIDEFEPEFDRIAAKDGPVRMIIELDDFKGWDFEGFWRDLKFDARHQDDLERVAVLGDKSWEELGVKASDPFLKANMRFFDRDEREAAEKWVRQ